MRLTLVRFWRRKDLVSNDVLHANHRDPFDQFILATALAEQMPVILTDENFNRYKNVVDVIW